LYAASLGLTTTDVGLSSRLAYDRVMHMAPGDKHCQYGNGQDKNDGFVV